jgi:hypothetical protein
LQKGHAIFSAGIFLAVTDGFGGGSNSFVEGIRI